MGLNRALFTLSKPISPKEPSTRSNVRGIIQFFPLLLLFLSVLSSNSINDDSISVNNFYKKLSIYLKYKKGCSVKFKLLSIDSDFISVKIYSPFVCYKGIPVNHFLSFFDLDPNSLADSYKNPISEDSLDSEDGSPSVALDDSLFDSGGVSSFV